MKEKMKLLLLNVVIASILKYNASAITVSNASSSSLKINVLQEVRNRIYNRFRKKNNGPGEPDPALLNEALCLIALNDIMERPRRIAWLKSTMVFINKLKDVDQKFKEEEKQRCIDDISKINEEDKENKCNLVKSFGNDFARLAQLFNDLDDLNKVEDVYFKLNRYPQYDENVTKPLHRIIEALQTKEINMKDLATLLGDVRSLQDLRKIVQYIPRAIIRIRMLHGLDNFKIEDLDDLPSELDGMDGFDIIRGIVQYAESKFRADVTEDIKKMSHSCKLNQEIK